MKEISASFILTSTYEFSHMERFNFTKKSHPLCFTALMLSSSSKNLGSHWFFYCFCSFAFSRILFLLKSYGIWNVPIGFFHLVMYIKSFSMRFRVGYFISFKRWIRIHCMDLPWFVSLITYEGHLDCFHILVIMTKTTINICVQIFGRT